MGGTPLELRGKTFGPLKVIGRWGSRTGNAAWAYWCRWCGHVGKRQGGALLRRTQRCPRCKTSTTRGPWRHPCPDEARVDALMARSPLSVPALPRVPRPLEHLSMDELCSVVDQAEAEQRLRVDLERGKGSPRVH